jgi:hypothetical protein
VEEKNRGGGAEEMNRGVETEYVGGGRKRLGLWTFLLL